MGLKEPKIKILNNFFKNISLVISFNQPIADT